MLGLKSCDERHAPQDSALILWRNYVTVVPALFGRDRTTRLQW